MSFGTLVGVFLALLGQAVAQESAPASGTVDLAKRRAELRQMAKGKTGAFAQLQLAHTARTWELTKEMWQHLDRAADAPRTAAVDRQMRAFLTTLEPLIVPERLHQAKTETRVRGLVRQVRPSLGAAKRVAIIEVLVREPNADKVLRDLAVREPLPEQRLAAVAALHRREAKGNEAFVHRRAVRDRDVEARRGTAELIKAEGNTDRAVRRLARGFLSDDPALRIFTAQALANLGNKDAAPLLVAAGPFAGTPTRAGEGGSTRAFMSKIDSRSYIRDFEVEIAQAAAVANPVVDVVREGVVLDATVHAVVSHRIPIERAYRAALKRLIGADPGPNPGTWAAWLAAHRPERAAENPEKN